MLLPTPLMQILHTLHCLVFTEKLDIKILLYFIPVSDEQF